jgi:hypothetical protein
MNYIYSTKMIFKGENNFLFNWTIYIHKKAIIYIK